MGIESLRPRKTFGLEDLGLLDTTPLRPIDTIVRLFAGTIQVSTVSFIVFDDRSSSVVIRSVHSNVDQRTGQVSRGNSTSLIDLVRDEASPISIGNLSTRDELQYAVERKRYGAVGYLGAPVFGPTGEVAGVLSAMTSVPHRWTRQDQQLTQDHAFLLSEQIMLRAALQTVRLMSRERAIISGANRSQN